MTSFMIGDRVAATRHAPAAKYTILANDCGTVCLIDRDGMVGVRWDKNVQGHTCGGRCEAGHGWKVWPRDLVLIDEKDTDDCDINEDDFISIIASQNIGV